MFDFLDRGRRKKKEERSARGKNQISSKSIIIALYFLRNFSTKTVLYVKTGNIRAKIRKFYRGKRFFDFELFKANIDFVLFDS